MLPLQNILGFVATDYIAYILQARFGIVPEPDGVDLDFLTLLKRVDFDLETILNLEPEHAAQVLIDLQSSKQVVELAERVDKAADTERDDVRKELSVTALAVVAEERNKAVIETRDLAGQVAALESALKVVEMEKSSARSRIEDLEKTVATYESQGFLARLRGLFSPKPAKGDTRDDGPANS